MRGTIYDRTGNAPRDERGVRDRSTPTPRPCATPRASPSVLVSSRSAARRPTTWSCSPRTRRSCTWQAPGGPGGGRRAGRRSWPRASSPASTSCVGHQARLPVRLDRGPGRRLRGDGGDGPLGPGALLRGRSSRAPTGRCSWRPASTGPPIAGGASRGDGGPWTASDPRHLDRRRPPGGLRATSSPEAVETYAAESGSVMVTDPLHRRGPGRVLDAPARLLRPRGRLVAQPQARLERLRAGLALQGADDLDRHRGRACSPRTAVYHRPGAGPGRQTTT